MTDTIIKREDLYQQVWTTPVIRLAPTYRISDVMLKKICKQLNVPTPPPGYWAQIKAGWTAKMSPLPKLPDGAPDSYTLHPDHPKISKPEIAQNPSTLELKKVVVSSRLTNPHPLIEKIRLVLEGEYPDNWGILRPRKSDMLNIQVGPDSVPRALRIMDTVLKTLEKREASFSFDSSENPHAPKTVVHLQGEEIHIRLRERIVNEKNAPSELVNRFKRKYPPKPWGYSYYPSGLLELYIDEYVDGKQKKWADTPGKKIEEKLGDFLIGLLDMVPALRQRRHEIEERNKRWEEEREQRRRWEKEQERFRELEGMAQTWTRSQELRSFVREVERRALAENLTDESKERLKEWVEWAMRHADRLDPISSLLPSEPPVADEGEED